MHHGQRSRKRSEAGVSKETLVEKARKGTTDSVARHQAA